MIALPDFQYGGMEHWGLVSYKERTLLYSHALPSSADRQRIATIIAHELGHKTNTLERWLAIVAATGIVLAIGFRVFNRLEPRMAEEV